MKVVLIVAMIVFTSNGFARKSFVAVKEADIGFCQKSSDCIIVPFRSCCGSTKKAINKKYLKIYNDTPAWQKFDDPQTCAVAGQCMSDSKVTEAQCVAGQCQLRFPN